jgi:hypothetical protein
MSAERHSPSGAFQDDPRSLRPIIPAEESPMPSKSPCDSLARPFIPAGPSTALAMPPTLRRRAVT